MRESRNQEAERQGIGTILHLDTDVTKNCDELKIKKGISEIVAKIFKKLGGGGIQGLSRSQP